MTRALNLPLFDIVKSGPPGGGNPRTGSTSRPPLECGNREGDRDGAASSKVGVGDMGFDEGVDLAGLLHLHHVAGAFDDL